MTRTAFSAWFSFCSYSLAILFSLCFIAATNGEDAAEKTSAELGSAFAKPPTIQPNPNDRAPLIAMVKFETRTPTIAALKISDGKRSWTQPGTGKPETQHELYAVGLRPSHKHTIRVQLSGPGGNQLETSDALEFNTPKLPRDFPPTKTIISHPDKMEPGFTFFAPTLWLDDKGVPNYGYLIALDAHGNVVWYLDTGHRVADFRLLSNGHLLYLHATFKYAVEVDLLGNIVRQWHTSRTVPVAPNKNSIPIYLDSMHHELSQLPNGNLVTLGTELRRFNEFPTSVSDSEASWKPAYVVCDEIIEFRPDDGWITRQIPLADILDQRRFSKSSLGKFWDAQFNGRIVGKAYDWTHANGLDYDESDDCFIVSLRHLDCLLKVSRDDGQLKWLLGNPEGWGKSWQKYFLKPEGQFDWPYHQHAPQLIEPGKLLIYDNGNYRSLPYEKSVPPENNYSRVVEFLIDEKNRSVKQTWEYRGDSTEKFYSPFYGEADVLPETGNVLITDGGHIESRKGLPLDAPPGAHQWARLIETTRDTPSRKVFEVVLDSGLESRLGWSIYRSIRASSFNEFKHSTVAATKKAKKQDSFLKLGSQP